jgi:RNA recognition motif-containing protein
MDFYRLFSQFVDVSRVDIIMDDNTGLWKGYGFVLMEKCEQAIEEFNHCPYNGRYLHVRFKNGTNNRINYWTFSFSRSNWRD